MLYLRIEQMVIDLAQRPPLLVEDVGHALEEQHDEDVLLVFGGIHAAAQDVGGFHQERFELREGDLVGSHGEKSNGMIQRLST